MKKIMRSLQSQQNTVLCNRFLVVVFVVAAVVSAYFGYTHTLLIRERQDLKRREIIQQQERVALKKSTKTIPSPSLKAGAMSHRRVAIRPPQPNHFRPKPAPPVVVRPFDHKEMDRVINSNSSSLIDHAYLHQILPNTLRAKQLRYALKFIEAIEVPEKYGDADGCENFSHRGYYATSIMGGGFCSQFQSLASNFMHALKVGGFSEAVLIEGQITGYSVAPECEPVGNEWTCYFEQPTPCAKALLAAGKRHHTPSSLQPYSKFPETLTLHTVPPPFQAIGEAFWWGAVQFYIFNHQQPLLRNYLRDVAWHSFLKHNHLSSSFHGAVKADTLHHIPIAGLHIRHGDKKDDNWQHYALSQAVDATPCTRGRRNKAGVCFVFLDLVFPPAGDTNDISYNGSEVGASMLNSYLRQRSLKWLELALAGAMTIIDIDAIDSYSRPSFPKSDSNLRSNNGHHSLAHNNAIIRGSSSLQGPDASKLIPKSELLEAISRLSRDTGNKNATGDSGLANWLEHRHGRWMTPQALFVVSDDPVVLEEARSRHGAWTFPSGVSQETGSKGMEKTLQAPVTGNDGKKTGSASFALLATQEIVRDVTFLAQCHVLVGAASSQVFRLAVALSNVTGVLFDPSQFADKSKDRLGSTDMRSAVALDRDQVAIVRELSLKYGVPFPEHFD